MTPTMRFQSVTVFGAGALGTLLGAHLARALPVTLVGRKAHMDAIRRRGIRVGGVRGRGGRRGAVRMSCAAEACPPVEPGTLCLVTVKAYDAGAAAKALADAGAAGAGCAVAFLQNGTGFERDVDRALGRRTRRIEAVCHIGATLVAPGRVDGWGGEMICEDSSDGRAFAELLKGCGLRAQTDPNVRKERWKKIAMNCALNPVTAILGLRNRETIVRELRPLRAAVLDECAAVSTALGVPLSGRRLLPEFEARMSRSNNVNSMLQDVRSGRRTEIEYLNGFFEREGPRLGIPCPANAALAALVRALGARPAP